jgi:hypothetical protein
MLTNMRQGRNEKLCSAKTYDKVDAAQFSREQNEPHLNSNSLLVKADFCRQLNKNSHFCLYMQVAISTDPQNS